MMHVEGAICDVRYSDFRIKVYLWGEIGVGERTMVKKPAKKAKAKKPAARKAAKPKTLRDQTPHLDDDAAVRTVRRQAGAKASRPGIASFRGVASISGWRVAAALDKLLKQINLKAPARSKLSDGAIGDTNHQNRSSDHNPWIIDGRQGVVTARDFTHDAAHGCDCTQLAEAIRASRDPRVKYIIWNRRICTPLPKDGMPGWAWRPYTGKNGHTHHMHLSVKPLKSLYDSETPWSIG
jgi:hypothetical protein